MSFRETILEQLRRNNRKVAQDFGNVFNAYEELVEKVLLLQHQNDKLRKESSGDGTGAAVGVGAGEIAKLRQEYAELCVKKTHNDQQLIDTNSKCQTQDKTVAELRIQLDAANHTIRTFRDRIKHLEEEVLEGKKTEQLLRDEYLALQTTCNGYEQRLRDTENELQLLIGRWKDLKEKEVEENNRQVEIAQWAQQQKIQAGLREAGNQIVPIFDVEKDALVLDVNGPVCGVAFVPTRCKLKFEAHENEVTSMAWSGSGKKFATGGADRKIKLWELLEGKQELKATLTGCNQGVMSVCFDTEEQQILAGSNDYACRIWTVSDYRCRHNLTGHSGKVLAARFHSANSHVVSGSHDRTIKLWDLKSRRCFKTLFAGSSCNDVATSEEYGTFIASAHNDKKIRLWDGKADRPFNEILLQGKITSLDLSSDGQYMLACTRDDTLVLIDVRTNAVVHTYCGESFRVGFDYTRAVLSPDAQFVAAGSADGQLFVWNVHSTKIEKILGKYHDTGITACAWNPNGSGILTCDRHRIVCYWTDI